MDVQKCRQYSQDLGIKLTSLELIQENKYCIIYRATTSTGPCIIKKYKGEDPALVIAEADALGLYHRLAQDDPRLIDSGPPLLIEEKNLLYIGFVDGEAFNGVLYRARNDASLGAQCVRLMTTLGKILTRIYGETRRASEETSPFIFEYFHYCSARLEELPVMGSILFHGACADASKLSDKLRATAFEPSFAHGDLVFKNMHVKDERIGLIDFANANPLSHPLNDIYNLRFALANMLIPRRFKADLLKGFYEGLGNLDFPETVHHFYYEYHRRRWLMLKLTSKGVGDVIQGLRGLMTFAKPFQRKVATL